MKKNTKTKEYWKEYWKNIVDDLEKKHSEKKHPRDWSDLEIQEFIIDLEEVVSLRMKNETHLRTILNLGNNNLYKSGDVSIISVATIKRLFGIKGSSLGTNHNKDLFAIYLGYKSAKHYYRKKISKIIESSSETTLQTSDKLKTSNHAIKIEIEKWNRQVIEESIWNPVKLVLHSHVSSHDLYQPIYLSPLNWQDKLMSFEAGEAREFQLAQTLYQESVNAISIHSLLTGLKRWTILIGIPGSGKTSSMKWLLRKVISENDNDYDTAIYFSLSHFDNYLQNHSNASVYSYFFNIHLNHPNTKAIGLGEDLSKVVHKENLKILFLADGLDEVSPSRRPFIVQLLNELHSEQDVIISTRPSAANKLRSLIGTSFYDIIPLPPPSVRNLVSKYCKLIPGVLHEDEILQKISDNIPLQKLAITPFVLLIVCEIINHFNLSLQARLNQAFLFSKLVQLMRADHNAYYDKYNLEQKHIEILQSFAYQLSFAKKKKTIKGTIVGPEDIKETLKHSRFLNEVGLNLGVFEFIHLRLQEYFTSLSLYHEEKKHIRKFINTKGLDPEWLEITCFLIGHAENISNSNHINQILKEQLIWIKKEKTGNGWYRLAKIQTSRGISLKDNRDLGIDIYQVLLDFILKIHPLYIKFIEILIESDGVFFIKDLSRYDPLVEVWENVYRLSPISFRKKSGLLDIVKSTELFSVRSMPGYGFFNETDLLEYRKTLKNWKNSEHKILLHAVQQVGIARDFASLNLLEPLVSNAMNITASAAIAIARIGGAEAAEILAKNLINQSHDYEKNLMTFAGCLNLKHGKNKALEPKSKKMLCDWLLSQEAPYPENTKHVIYALEGVSISKNIEDKIIEMFLNDALDQELRAYLIFLVPSIKNNYNLIKLMNGVLHQENKFPMSIINSIANIPINNDEIITRVQEKIKTSSNRIKLSLIKLLVKSYTKYTNQYDFSFVPNLIKEEFSVSIENNNNQIRYRVNLWEIVSTYFIDNSINDLAWNDLIDQKLNNLPVKTAALKYLYSIFYSLDNSKAEELKKKLVENQKQPQLRAYVQDALSFLLSRSKAKGEDLLLWIDQYFDKENREFFKDSIIKEATLLGKLIVID